MSRKYGFQDERQVRQQMASIERQTRDARNEDVLIDDARRLILRSPDGHFWSLSVDNAGALTTTDMGTTL